MYPSMRKKLMVRCFHFDEDGRPTYPLCKRGTANCGFVHPEEAAWVTAQISENYEPPNRDRRSDYGHGRRHYNDYDDYDRPPPPPPRQTPAALIASIAGEQARNRQEVSNNPAASSSRLKSSTVPSAPRSLSQLDIPTTSAAIASPSSASPRKTSSTSMSALNPSASTHQQQIASTATPTTKPTPKPTPRPTPIIPPPPTSGGFSNTFSSLSLDSPGFPPNNTTSLPQSKPADDDAMHVDQPLPSSGLNSGNSRPSPSDAQHHSASPAGSASQPPPPPPNPPPELPYQPPPPIPGVPDGLKFPEDRSRQPSVAPSDAGSGSGSGRRPSLSIAQEDPRYVKWMTVIRVLSRCMDIEAELRTIERNIEDARSFIAIGAMERLDSSLDGLSASTSAAVPLTPTAGTSFSSFSSSTAPPPGSTTPTSATAPGFTIPSNSTVLPPMELSEELTSLIARRESLLNEKTESWDKLANPDSWPTALQQHPGLVTGAGLCPGGDAEGGEPPVDYRALVGAVADFKDIVRTLMQLLAEHVAFFEKKRKMPEMPEELRDLRMEDEDEEDERGEEGEVDERDELGRELEREMERQERMEDAAREEVGDVVPEVGNLSLEEEDKDGDVAMHDVEGPSARHHDSKKALKQEEEGGSEGGSVAEAGRGHKRRRLNMAGDAEPTPEEVEQMRSALQKLEDKISSILNDSTQAEETWKEEYEIMVEERVNAYMKDHADNHKKRMLRYRNKVKELEKEKAAWEEREKEREQGAAMQDEPDAGQEERWMRMLHNETLTVQAQGPDEEVEMSFSKLWGDVQSLHGDLEPVRAEVAYTKAEVAELTHELAMERVELAKVKNEADRMKESLEKQIQEQQELATAITAIDTYIRNTVEEIAAHRVAAAAAPAPPLPSQRVLLQHLEPLLIDAIREDIKPTLVKHREEIEHTVQDGAKQLFMQFATKLGLTMNIMEAIHKRMDDEPGMLESLANSIQPAGSSTSSS